MKLKNHQGFTLVEMAIVLLIMALILGSGLTVLTSQIEQQRIKDTQRLMEDAREALIGFAMVNGRLPCPAPATAVTGTALAGLEPTPLVATGCVNEAGVLPWASLGVAETDAWANRFTYRVSRQFTRTIPQTTFTGAACPPPTLPTLVAFALCSQGDMTIMSRGAGATLSANVPTLVISHGQNGNGAYNSNGVQRPIGTDADEQDNQLTVGGTNTANRVFINDTPTATYDDTVVWLSPSLLFNRMVQAGRLP